MLRGKVREMHMTITLDGAVAERVSAEAAMLDLSPAEVAAGVLAEAVGHAAGHRLPQGHANLRRWLLIQKSVQGPLTDDEVTEFEVLQAQARQRVEMFDQTRAGHLGTMRQEVEQALNAADQSC